METLKLMAVLAHPDDESLGVGGTLAKYAAEGVETYLVCATRGERGWFGEAEAYPGPAELGRLRQAELQAAAQKLGLGEVNFLDYLDGDLDQVDPLEATGKIVAHLRRVRPQVVITFDPTGDYGHPDHIAISQLTTAAIVAAADPTYPAGGVWPAHRVSKLYYRVPTREEQTTYEAAFGDLIMHIDGVERRAVPWESWTITTWLDTLAHCSQTWSAVLCHRSQLPGYQALQQLSQADQEKLWATETYYRAFSLVNGGRQIERDLFAGLRKNGGGNFE